MSEWTQTLPSEPGYYWYEQVMDVDAYPHYGGGVCEVSPGRVGLDVHFPGDDRACLLDWLNASLFWWCGPLERPERR